MGPLYLPYEKDMEVPPGYQVKRPRYRGLMVAGGVTFGAGYLLGLGIGGSHGFENGEGWLLVPVIGPFAALAARQVDKCDIDVNGSTDIDDLVASEDEVEACFEEALDEAIRLAVITADGVVQVVGASLLAGGIIGGPKRLERKEPRVRARPQSFGRRGIGIGIRGTF